MISLREPIRIILTGRPGVGKTTLFNNIMNQLRVNSISIGGFVAPEVRQGNRRIGFDIIDLYTGEKGVLARICDRKSRFSTLKVGKYCVNRNDVLRIGVNALVRATKEADLIGIDEIGPMELKVPELRSAVYETLGKRKMPLISVVHWRAVNKILHIVPNAKVFYVTISNRDVLLSEVLKLLGFTNLAKNSKNKCNRSQY